MNTKELTSYKTELCYTQKILDIAQDELDDNRQQLESTWLLSSKQRELFGRERNLAQIDTKIR